MRLPVRSLVAIAIALIGLSAFHMISLDGLLGNALLMVLGDDTRYAAGYSSSVFRAVSEGDLEEDVIRALGDPLAIAHGPGTTVLHYSDSPNQRNYRIRGIRVRDGRVEHKATGVWLD